MNKYLTELIGTFFLVLIICCTVLGGGPGVVPPLAIGAVLMVMILPGVHLDVHGNYQFVEWEKIESLDEEIDTDTVTLGAALRIEL